METALGVQVVVVMMQALSLLKWFNAS